MKAAKKIVRQYRWVILFLFMACVLLLVSRPHGIRAFTTTFHNLKEMMLLIPPVFILMGLIDVWVPKETLTKYMGRGSGITGYLIALLLGTAAAGALYVAFPIGLMLLQKGARLSTVIFFLGVWSTCKLPVLMFEIASLGLPFTLIHVAVNLPICLIIALVIEKTEKPENLRRIIGEEGTGG